MRVFLGMVLGAILTVAFAYLYDSTMTSSPANGAVATAQRTMVNWDVVEANWRELEANLRELKARAREGWNKVAG
jgi:hypothetical protein